MVKFLKDRRIQSGKSEGEYTMLDKIKNYIEKYGADLKDNNFDAFYSHMQIQTLNPLLTEVFLDLDIDPLDYLTKIPGYYAAWNTKIKNLNISP